jgi:ABC-type antimicrobial peptide transport system permease subunit
MVVKKMMASFMSFFAIAALLLAAFGIYGVIAYSVSLRTQDFGIRMALGAKMSDVILMVLKQGMQVVLIGMGFGLFLSLILTQLMKSLLFQVNVFDPITYTAVIFILMFTAIMAGFLPAWRASKVDPMTALRCE